MQSLRNPRLKTAPLLLVAALALSACSQSWSTEYNEAPQAQLANTWRVSSVSVAVPSTLTVSEANSFAPDADIVWQAEAPGNRHEQVRRIMQEAGQRGVAGLRGATPVRLEIIVHEFHALTNRARWQLSSSGVHNIGFALRVKDARSGAVLASEDDIRADLVAFTGQEAMRAELAGQTQRVRIVNHTAKVIAGWLGTGPDVRASFVRRGR